MRIDRVYVASHRHDLRFTRCCVASIRRWYPELPITLIKDESRGSYSTEELEKSWNVTLFRGDRPIPGRGWGKLEPLFQPGHERCLIVDSDIVFVGPVIEKLAASDADVVVPEHGTYPLDIQLHHFDLEALAKLDPDFRFPGYIFNAGQFVATTGILEKSDFEPFVRLGDRPEKIHPDVFRGNDQGILNYVVLKKRQAGELTLERVPFMWWVGSLPRGKVKTRKLGEGSPYPFLVHWAGPKRKLFLQTRNGYLLRYFDAYYHSRVPRGRRERWRRSFTRLRDALSRGS